MSRLVWSSGRTEASRDCNLVLAVTMQQYCIVCFLPALPDGSKHGQLCTDALSQMTSPSAASTSSKPICTRRSTEASNPLGTWDGQVLLRYVAMLDGDKGRANITV